MSKISNRGIATFLITVCSIFILSACNTFSGPSNKWRVEVSESAKSTGDITLRVSPEDEAYTDVNVRVFEGTGENYIAHRIKDAFKEQLPDKYSVEVDDGEDVLIKKRNGVPDFRLYLVRNTVDSVRINLDRE